MYRWSTYRKYEDRKSHTCVNPDDYYIYSQSNVSKRVYRIVIYEGQTRNIATARGSVEASVITL